MKTLIFLVSLTLSLGAVAGLDEQQPIMLLSDSVITMVPGKRNAQPLGVEVRGERISWVGPKSEARQRDARFVDLGRQALLPGFIDAHGHIAFVGMSALLANVASPPVGPVENINDLRETLSRYIEANGVEPGAWVIGRGYDDSLLAERRHPDRDDLDAVSTQHPIALIHVSGHLAAANSKALAQVGISADSPDPLGGLIRRRPGSSEPNGVLEETAIYPIRAKMTAPIKDPVASIGVAMREYARFGITTAQDGASNPDSIALLKAADRAGHVTLDVVAFPTGQHDEHTTSAQYEFGVYDGRIKVGGVKLMLDGSPQGKTAYLTKPYHVAPQGQDDDYVGYPNIPQARVNDVVRHYVARQIPIIAHANGDAAADMLIEAVAEAQPRYDHRTVMIHAQTVREDQLTRMKNLAMIPSFFSAHTFYWGDWHRDSVFGIERASRISPTSSTLARGMIFTVHNDAPVVPPDSMRLLWATTNRLTRSKKVLGANQRISTYDALAAMTINAAYQHFEERAKGSIEVGKQADLVVLSEDPLTVDPLDLQAIEIVATYARGRAVYERKLTP